MEKSAIIEFVSYDGGFPNLCRGTLILNINGVLRWDFKLCSGGRITTHSDGTMSAEEGRWSVRVPDDLACCKREIEACVNKHVPKGCCGGCI